MCHQPSTAHPGEFSVTGSEACTCIQTVTQLENITHPQDLTTEKLTQEAKPLADPDDNSVLLSTLEKLVQGPLI